MKTERPGASEHETRADRAPGFPPSSAINEQRGRRPAWNAAQYPIPKIITSRIDRMSRNEIGFAPATARIVMPPPPANRAARSTCRVALDRSPRTLRRMRAISGGRIAFHAPPTRARLFHDHRYAGIYAQRRIRHPRTYASRSLLSHRADSTRNLGPQHGPSPGGLDGLADIGRA